MRHLAAAALTALLCATPARAEGTEYVLAILDLHEKLATNEAFQQQAKMLGAYMLEAQGMDHDNQIRVYQSVIRILRQIDAAGAHPAPAPAAPPAAKPPAPEAPSETKPAGETPVARLDAGAAHIEWFRVDSLDATLDVPLASAHWRRDLFAMGEEGDKDLPAQETPAAARITFYYEAKIAGEHAFAAQNGSCHLRLLVGTNQVVDLPRSGPRTGRQVVHLEQGFHRIDLLLLYGKGDRPSFLTSVLPPGATESRLITKADLLLKRPVPTVAQ